MANDSGRSDNLQDLVGLVEDSKSPLVRLLSEVVSIKIIIDANVAYKAIRWIAVKRKNPAAKPEILELIETGYVEIHAPKFIDDEIQEHLHEIVEKSGKTSEQIQQLWSDLKSNIHLHDTSSLPELPTEVAEVDPDDVPYIQLHQKLNHQIVSDDKHISKMGGRGTDLTVISRLKDLYRANATEYQFAISGYGIMVLGSHVIPGLLSMLKNALAGLTKLPGWLQFLLAIKLIDIYNNPGSNRKFIDMIEAIADFVPELTKEIVTHVGDSFVSYSEAKTVSAEIMKELPPDFLSGTKT